MCETSQRHTGPGHSQRRQQAHQATLEAGEAGTTAADAWKNLAPPPPPPQKKIAATARPNFNPPPPKVTPPPAPAPKAPNPVVAATKRILSAAGFGAAASTPQSSRPAAPAVPAISFDSQLKELRTVPDKTEKLTKILDLALSHEQRVAHTESKDAKKARTSLILSELHLALRGEAVKPMMLEANMKGILIQGIRGELAATLGSTRAKDQFPIFLRG